MQSEPSPRTAESLLPAIGRNLTVAMLVGVVVAVVGRSAFLVLPGTLVALWPSLGGHFVEVAFLEGVRPRLPGDRFVQASARIGWWLAGGAVLGLAMLATARLLPVAAPRWHWWWLGAPLFLVLELSVHSILALVGRPNFFRGDG